jgi:cobalt transporter subunit CbtB
VSQETCQHDGAWSGKVVFHFSGSTGRPSKKSGEEPMQLHTEGVAMNATATASAVSSLSLSQRLIAGGLALFLGLVLVMGVGFAGDQAIHNGAHDTRHAMGFPCH